MSTFTVLAEPTTFSVRPGGRVYLENPLNQGDSIDISINWSPWLGAETVSSVAWDAESGITVSGSAVASPLTSCVLTAGNVEGTFKVECAMTSSGGQVRSVVLYVEIVDLR